MLQRYEYYFNNQNKIALILLIILLNVLNAITATHSHEQVADGKIITNCLKNYEVMKKQINNNLNDATTLAYPSE